MHETPPEDPVLAEAVDWMLRLEAAPEDAVLRARLEAWCQADPAHARAWAAAGRAWNVLGLAGPRPAPPGLATARPQARMASLGRRRLGGAALAAAAAAAGILALPEAGIWLRAAHATGTGETRRVALPDGSHVHLAPRSAVAITFSDTARQVELLRGEAFLEVFPNPARPFTALAEALAVRVLGTAFDLRLGEERLEVAVQHGRVRLDYRTLSAELIPGQRMALPRGSGPPERGTLPPAEVASWRDGLLFVQDASIAEVVETLRRYHPGWLLLRDPVLAARRVTGIYDLRDVPRALVALVRPHGGQVRGLTPLLLDVVGPG